MMRSPVRSWTALCNESIYGKKLTLEKTFSSSAWLSRNLSCLLLRKSTKRVITNTIFMALKTLFLHSFISILAAIILCWTEVTSASGKWWQIHIVHFYICIVRTVPIFHATVVLVAYLAYGFLRQDINSFLWFQIPVIAQFAVQHAAGVWAAIPANFLW